ncbi:MAG: DEAD/DEAH box helicase [Candidatus Gastranaerophilaceae bacterium]
MKNRKFEAFQMSDEMRSAISDMGFTEASPIQAETYELIMEGRDLVAQAHTGSGKTAAYSIPSIEKIDLNDKSTQLLILCPTRELVMQVGVEVQKLAKYKDITIVTVYGGQQIDRQLSVLKRGAQILIATPGRLMDHMKRKSVDISKIKTVVLDEADEMLDMGFREDIHTILQDSPEERQTIMFSATMEKDILKLTQKFQNNPVIVNVMSEKLNNPEIEQVYFEVVSKNKLELLSRLLDMNNVQLGLIFCNTKSMVDDLVESLKTKGYFADGLHGDLNQNQRERVMRKFRTGSTQLLVATDVAGRGIDVDDVEAVFNYDLPRDDEDYVHRIGRTGRAGKKGKAFTFVSRKEVSSIKRIEKANGVQIFKKDAPGVEEIEEAKFNSFLEEIKSEILKGDLFEFKELVKSVMGENFSEIQVAAALMKMSIAKKSSNFDKSIDFDMGEYVEEKTRRSRGGRSRGQRNSGFGRANGSKERGSKDFKMEKPKFEFRKKSRKKTSKRKSLVLA